MITETAGFRWDYCAITVYYSLEFQDIILQTEFLSALVIKRTFHDAKTSFMVYL